jgi:hypothetical protein
VPACITVEMSDPKDKESENSTRTNQHTKDPKTLTAGSSTCGAQKAVGAIALKVPKNCQLRQFFGFFFFFLQNVRYIQQN